MSHIANQLRPGKLLAPERNHYFYGKMLDERSLQMEQEYFNNKRRLLNRLGLGAGVLCGLDVAPSRDGKGLCILPGVAIDALGREIIVSQPWCFDPWVITQGCGQVKGTLDKGGEHTIRICLAYNECFADYEPVLAADCNLPDQCSPGTVRESFCVWVSEFDALPEPGEVDEKICQALNASGKSSQKRERLCGVTHGACAEPTGDVCVTLATVTLHAGGTGGTDPVIVADDIDLCRYRTVVYSNAMLLDMILCLAQRVEECCNQTPRAHVSLIKEADGISFQRAGSTIQYTLTLTNDGNVPLTNVNITDPGLTLTCTPAQPVDLMPGDTLTCTGSYTTTQADLDAGFIKNTAQATGTDPDGKTVTTQPVTVTIPAIQRPHLALVKTADLASYQTVGETITYTLTVSNDGNITCSNVSISDAGLTLTCTPAQPVDLAPGDSITCTANYSVTQADIDAGLLRNTASATGSDPTGQTVSAAPVTVTIPALQNPHLSLTKSANPVEYQNPGEVIQYTLTATNDGNVTLTNIAFHDPALGALNCPTPAPFAPGDTVNCTGSYTITAADVTRRRFKNTATVNGTDPHNQQVTATADYEVKAKDGHTDDTFQVSGIELVGLLPGGGTGAIAKLAPDVSMQPNPISLGAQGRISEMIIHFNRKIDINSITVARHGDSHPRDDNSVFIHSNSSPEADGAVVGRIVPVNATTVRFLPDDWTPLTTISSYEVTLFGDPGNRTPTSPYIVDSNGVPLDGEPTQLPSGDGTPQGNFYFKFDVVA